MTDWQTVKLGDVAYEVSDRVDNPSTSGYDRFVGLDSFVSGDFKISNWSGTDDLISAMKLFKAGDTLFARRNAYLKRASMVDFDGICSGDAIVLRNNEKMIDGFLPLVLNTNHFWNYAIANAAGSMSKRVRVEDLMKYEFPLPLLDEQRKMVELISAFDDVQENLKNLKKNSQELYLSLSTKVLFPRYSKSDVVHQIDSLIPEEWNIDYLENLVLEDAPICYGIVQPGLSVEDGIPTLAIKDMKGNFSDGVHRTSSKIEKGFIRSRIQGNDVLVSVKATIGEILIVPEWFKGNISRDLARIRLKENVLPNYFLHLWRSPIFQQDVLKLIIGSTRAELRIGDLRKLRIPVPEIEIQKKIVEKLDAVTSAIREQEKHMNETKGLRFAFVNRMLNNNM